MKSKQQLRRRADKIWGQIILTLYNKCFVCGAKAIDPHHFIPKGRCAKLRYNLDNGVALCRKCHIKHHWHSDPTIVATIVEKKGKDWYKRIKKMFQNAQKQQSNSFLTKKYYEEVINKLTTLA